MYTIDNTPFENYGMYISTHTGHAHFPEPKEQLVTVYGEEGYKITKRTPKILNLQGFLIANDLEDFKTKTAALRALFGNHDLRKIELNNGLITCFAKDGFSISKVRVLGKVYAQIEIKLTIL